MTVPAAAKKPLPRPSFVSTETIAGIELLTTSSRDEGAEAAETAGAAAAPGGVVHASEKLKGPGVYSCDGVSTELGTDGSGATGLTSDGGDAVFRTGTIWIATSAPMAIA